ncbi:hypothetical protein EJ08DRAFT_679140 [Tothia fuscella]|uniref:Heterokaryon incompatibility domain-containing protein n=1 Tax=Tothia fuscella TaxID=1048955 RepID=A0A9P4NSJ0_9PEZI|nr:hypothetical protein EJ08DRAFT_679140 [Tothia fuscella]
MKSQYPLEPYQYSDLLSSYRILELLTGKPTEPIRCFLHTVHWPNCPKFEAVSYAWGDPNTKTPIHCHGKRLDITTNLHSALLRLRYEYQSRFLWADAICTNQSNNQERGTQVAQMRKIYEAAVLVWVGSDGEVPQAKVASVAVTKISDAICEKLGISMSDLSKYSDMYNDFVFKNRDRLPRPEDITLGDEATWESLVWLYSQPYYTRVWVVQEINSNPLRIVYCGAERMDWDRLQLVAGYIIAESAWSKKYGFSKAYCWWGGRMTASGFSRAENWLQMMYLASNFDCSDLRDQIFGLSGLIKSTEGANLLRPDYSKTTREVYRDSVEAAFLDFQNTDILNYTPGTEMARSWPAGNTKVVWKIDKEANILHLTGVIADILKLVEPYNENYFCNSKLESEDGRQSLNESWSRIFRTVQTNESHIPVARATLTALATSISFGLDENADPADEKQLLLNFVAYLNIALEAETFNRCIPADLATEAAKGDGKAFGKPVWDFDYLEFTLFITTGGLLGCTTAINKLEDIVFIPLGSTYPLILRPEDSHYTIRGFAFVYQRMIGKVPTASESVEIW